MFALRMARKPFFHASLWFIVLSQLTAVTTFELSNEFSDFVPSCAEECFLSFLDVSHGFQACGRRPSLQCLCSRLGASEYTVGEGAVQCIAAERAIGYCSHFEASDAVIQNAFNMCNEKPGAIIPTRATITATLVLPPSGSKGVIKFPPVTTSTTTTSSIDESEFPTSLPTTLVIDTSLPPSLPITRTRSSSTTSSRSSFRTSSSFSSFVSSFTSIVSSDTQTSARPTSFTTSSTSAASSTETSTETGVPVVAGGKQDDALSSAQVAGISIGVLAAAGFAIGAILLARYYRRRNHPNLKTTFFPRRDTWGYKSQPDNEGPQAWMATQIKAPLDVTPPKPPPTYNRASYKPEGIGMAISPAHSRVTPQPSPMRRVSRLLPAKPILPILPLNVKKRFSRLSGEGAGRNSFRDSRRESSSGDIPTAVSSPFNIASPGRSKPLPPGPPKLQIPIPESGDLMGKCIRESTLTEFEEDGTLSAGEKVWRPPPTTPLSATTFYVADQHGNWVLGDPKRASAVIPAATATATATTPTASSTNVANVANLGSPDETVTFGAVKVANPDKTPQKPATEQPKASLAPPLEISRMASQSSSVYSQQSAPRPTVAAAAAAAAAGSYPLFSSHPNPAPRRSSSLQRSNSRNLTRPRENSIDSGITVITTSSEDLVSDPSPLEAPRTNLSPVAESPRTLPRNSPKTHPKIPMRDPRRLSQQTMIKPIIVEPKTAPPPPRTVVYQPPGQPSPTLGMSTPPIGPGLSSYTVPTKPRRPIDNPALEKTGSPTMRVVDPSPPTSTEDLTQEAPMERRDTAYFFDSDYAHPTNAQLQTHTHLYGPRPYQANGPLQQHPYAGVEPQPHHQPYRPYQQPHQQSHPQPYQHPHQQPFSQRMHHQQQQPHPNSRQPRQYPGHLHPNAQQHPPYPQQPNHHPQQRQPRPRSQLHYPNHPQQRPPQGHMGLPQRPKLDHHFSTNSGSSSSGSSLLAKRLGNDRAANMTIPTDKVSSKWQRDGNDINTPRTADSGLPSTPVWLPRLTPTRRGDDLYLDVQ